MLSKGQEDGTHQQIEATSGGPHEETFPHSPQHTV